MLHGEAVTWVLSLKWVGIDQKKGMEGGPQEKWNYVQKVRGLNKERMWKGRNEAALNIPQGLEAKKKLYQLHISRYWGPWEPWIVSVFNFFFFWRSFHVC